MLQFHHLARHRATRVIAIGTAIKLAIALVAYALLFMRPLVTAAL